MIPQQLTANGGRQLLLQRRWLATALSTAERVAAHHRRAIKQSGAPESIRSIPDAAALPIDTAGVVIRNLGATRRVILREPYLKLAELEGLAYRIRTLTKNEALNSVLIATDARDDRDGMTSMAAEADDPIVGEFEDDLLPPAPGKTFFVSCGYDPLELYTSGLYKNNQAVETLLNSISNLALATRGYDPKSRIPVITIPHGAVQDAGFALCLSSYVLATYESSFRIRNPSRGLSLDPVGLSYLLPRLGREFKQPSAEYAGCGVLLGCFGFEADAFDMVETGLATNYMESPQSLALLEATLSELPPWNQQGVIKNKPRFHGVPKPDKDEQAQFRNKTVADTIFCFTQYRADGADLPYCLEDEDFLDYDDLLDDPSLETDPMKFYEMRSSDLVNYAATFNDIFKNESTLVGILEGLRKEAARKSDDPDERLCIGLAQDFVERLEQQSPLAVSVVHRLLQMGGRTGEGLESCMKREIHAQTMLLNKPDYASWAEHAKTNATEPFKGWSHKSLSDVTEDEVLEVIGSETPAAVSA